MNLRQVLFNETFEGLTIERVIRDYEFSMQTKHLHNEYEIYYLLDGERYYFIEKESYYVRKGDLVLINKGFIHKTSSAQKSYHDRILITFKGEKIEPIFKIGGLSFAEFFGKNAGVIHLNLSDQNFVESTLNGMANEMKNKNSGYDLLLYVKLVELLIYIHRNGNVHMVSDQSLIKSSKHRKVQEIADYIVINYNSIKSLDELANNFFISKFYLSRIFKEISGFTITEYINIQKVRKAQELLENEKNNITRISELLGYESITYFEKVFKKYMEMTPMKYRKNLLENDLL